MCQKTSVKFSSGSPEDELFQKALRFLYKRRLDMEGLRADVTVVRPEPEEAPQRRATA